VIIIGERIHVISPRVKAAFDNRDTCFLQDLAMRQVNAGAQFVDLNIGPARKTGLELMPWVVETVQAMTGTPLSLDTTNADAMEAGLRVCKNKSMVNSTSAQPERMEKVIPLAAEHNSDLIALTLTEKGIPPEATGRAEVAMQLIEAAAQAGIGSDRLYLDPLVLPVGADQAGAGQTIEAIRFFKAIADPAPFTVIGLSNISNGSPHEIRGLINRAFLVMAMGAGLDAAIADPNDRQLMEAVRIVEARDESTGVGRLLVALRDSVANMEEELDPSVVDMDDPAQVDIFKTVRILQNKTLYAHSYLKV
jgi:5-methyltetrahydrofolate corrinoid/iron sulfur protein methyltransferase